MATPKVLVLSGYGINCEEESAHAFQRAGAKTEIRHVNDIISERMSLSEYQILMFPGGFSFGDDTGSGNAFANKVRGHLWDDVRNFVGKDKLVLGVCNGFQILVNLGLVPALNNKYGERQAALLHNDSARYIDTWVDVTFRGGSSSWTKGLQTIPLPIAHGEGKFYASPNVLKKINEKGMVAARYIVGELVGRTGELWNPNGSLEGIAGITDESGRVLGMMPHPERAIDFMQLPDWTYQREQLRRRGQKMPTEGPGLAIFRNGVNYFG